MLVVALCLTLGHSATWPLGHSATVFAEIPHLIRYQGQATDSQGVPLEGPYTLTFRLYDAEIGGSDLWKEEQTNVPLGGGNFSTLLGQQTPLNNIDWTRPCWLSIQVNGEPELSPRQRITSVPTAIVADRLSVPVATSTITDDENSLVPAGAILLWTGANCPAGYTRLSALDGKFLVGGVSYKAAAGGSNTHAHGAGSYTGPSHAHSFYHGHDSIGNARGAGSQCSNGDGGGCQTVNQSNSATDAAGAGAVGGTSALSESRPEFATVLLCQKD